MRDAKLADTNTRLLLKLNEQLMDALRAVAWDLANCTPDAPEVRWGQHAAAFSKIDAAIRTAEQNVAYHMRKKKPQSEACNIEATSKAT